MSDNERTTRLQGHSSEFIHIFFVRTTWFRTHKATPTQLVEQETSHLRFNRIKQKPRSTPLSAHHIEQQRNLPTR